MSGKARDSTIFPSADAILMRDFSPEEIRALLIVVIGALVWRDRPFKVLGRAWLNNVSRYSKRDARGGYGKFPCELPQLSNDRRRGRLDILK